MNRCAAVSVLCLAMSVAAARARAQECRPQDHPLTPRTRIASSTT